MCARLKIAPEFTPDERSYSGKNLRRGGEKKKILSTYLSVPIFKATFKWRRELRGWHLEAGIRLQSPKASTGSSSNGDHTHISLYNVTHYT